MNTVIRISIFTLFYSEYRECTEKKITKDFWVTFRCIVMFITSTFISRLHTQQFHINKPTLNLHSNRHFYVSEKKFPQELLSPQIIFIFIEGSPVNKSVKYQNRGTMGVQIPFSFPQSLDFKPLQAKARFLPWQIKSTRIIKIFPPKLPRYAKKCEVLLGFPNILFFQV